jgi:photosystem II stability/assembly factor-like uncharacterized protein
MSKKSTLKSGRKTRKKSTKSARTPEAVDLNEAPPEELIEGLIKPLPARGGGARKTHTRLSNHKARSTWFQNRATWPVREAPTRALVRAREAARKSLPRPADAPEWQSIGPTNVGGRLTSLVCHPVHPERVWAGAAGGGVWYSPDAGQTWQPQWHRQDVLNVGALALDPSDPEVIYCGTGEANLSADSYPGVGIYRTGDGGRTWRLHASAEKTGIPRRIGVIAVDPFDPKHLLVGGIGFGEVGTDHDLGGLYTSTDGGDTWRRETFIAEKNYWCHSVVFHPTARGRVYATFTARGVRNGIYRSDDGGGEWEHLTKGLPPSERIGRATLAISPSRPDVLYAIATDELSERADLTLGVYRTTNGGRRWTDITRSHFDDERQMSYNTTIVVHPTRPNYVICGGVDLHRTEDGGKTWALATDWGNRLGITRGDPRHAHADHHCLLMPAALPGRVYDANDGGLDVSDDGGRNWVNRSTGLAVTMYYDMDVAQSDARVFGGGAQDNGTLMTQTGGSHDHFELLDGDGGWITFDPHDAEHIYASYQNMGIFRYRAGKTVEVTPKGADDDERNAVWMCYIAMDPNNPRVVFTGSHRVWRTKSDGKSWKPVSPTLDGSPITAIEIARADSRRVYVGTENGMIFRSRDGGDTWSANISSATLPGYSITRLLAHPEDAEHVYVTLAHFGHSHVYRSRDGGLNWEDVDKGRLPDVPHHSLAIPPDFPDTVYVCNDAGVFASPDGGETWVDMTGNLPNVMVIDLAYHRKEGTLSAATYGRSLWRLKVRQP